ncbi:MAG: N-acetylmuramoyl-L-alanine amidase-like domain-containing protein [Verrucomicrobiota bacterium]
MLKKPVLAVVAWVSLTALASSGFAGVVIPEYQPRLPFSTVFKGKEKFDWLVAQAVRENWRALPIGERTARVGTALLGTPYVNYTLEIDDRIESPSVNFNGLDCWTFYEVSLAFARMLRVKDGDYRPEDLLALIELERYRDGHCTGSFLSRMHFLEEVFSNNGARGLSVNPTSQMGGVRLSRNITEMTSAWQSYRYLRNNPGMLPELAQIQDHVSCLPVYYIPRERVGAAEKFLQTGDIIAITSRDKSGYTSHVGMAVRKWDGVHFMHATSRRSAGRKVILDGRISKYLNSSSDHSGIIVYRPFDVR